MAEGFYSTRPHETKFVDFNVPSTQQFQQAQQKQQQIPNFHSNQQQTQQLPIMGPANVAASAVNNEVNYLAKAGYFNMASVDDNNNLTGLPLRYLVESPNDNNSSNYSKSLISNYGSYLPSGLLVKSNSVEAPPGLSTSGPHIAPGCHYAQVSGNASCYIRNRYMPYSHNRTCAASAAAAAMITNTANTITAVQTTSTIPPHISSPTAISYSYQQFAPIYQKCFSFAPTVSSAAASAVTNLAVRTALTIQSSKADLMHAPTTGSKLTISTASAALGASASGLTAANLQTPTSFITSTPFNAKQIYGNVPDPSQTVTLQITNLDYTMDEAGLRNFLLNQLKPITPMVSLTFEGSSYAKVTVPDLYVVSSLHRKKIGHKRILVSYTRDSSLTEINTLRCQVAGLLKDVPYYTLPIYKFRELFQSRFKTSIGVVDLYKMPDICSINSDNNEEKFITLQPELINSLESSPLMKGLQHSVPYCTIHFKREQHKGWAEQDIEPLPNVCMTISEIQQIIYPLLKNHTGDIPVASLVHCIEGELNIKISSNENGVNLEHLVCCVQDIQIQVNNFGIKILGWLKLDKDNVGGDYSSYTKNVISDPLYQISREVIELVKMSPKSTMKFNRFIPAYHNHFGKQCRVADYGYTKLIELFEALSSVVQIMGDGENRQITLTHRTQIRRFTSDLLRVLRAHGNKSVLLSELPIVFAQTQSRNFDVTDYGVCDIVDILDGLVNSNIIIVSTVQNGKDILISIPKRKQTHSEIEKTCIFAGEMVELFRNAPQYTIPFQKFVRSYHYHFAYQCRLNDYGFLKLADLMEAIHGVVEMEHTNDEDKKIFLSPKVAQRVFAEQCEELIRSTTGSSKTCVKLDSVLNLHKKKFGYQILPQTLGVSEIAEAIKLLPYVEVYEQEGSTWLMCHNDDAIFRTQCYRACKYILSDEFGRSAAKVSSSIKEVTQSELNLEDFISSFNNKHKDSLTVNIVQAMKHAIEIYFVNDKPCVRISSFMKFLINIVRLLEQRCPLTLQEIKYALDCSINTTFEYGYPNLYTILTAYPDLFSVNMGISQERSEILLAPNCELRSTSCEGSNQQQQLLYYSALKLPLSKQKPTRATRMPLGEHNRRSVNAQGPPAKTRAIANDENHMNTAYQASSYHMPTTSMNSNNGYYATANIPLLVSSSSTQSLQQTTGPNKHYMALTHTAQSSISDSSNYSSSGNTNTSGCANTSGNKENSFNSSFSIFNGSLNSSSHSNSDLNASSTYMDIVSPSKLWDRHQTMAYQQKYAFCQHQQQQQQQQHQHALYQQQQQSVMCALPSIVVPTPANILMQPLTLPIASEPPSTLSETGLFEFVRNRQTYSMYVPPKPDTPPPDNMPFWIDPIWTNNSSVMTNSKNDSLNIQLPDVKSINEPPIVLSPYTLSKVENMKQKVFNFDSKCRKIA